MEGDTLNSKSNYSEEEKLNSYTWKEIKDSKNWIVINDLVYDVTNFMKKHPGSERLLQMHVGEDCTVKFILCTSLINETKNLKLFLNLKDVFTAFHTDLKLVAKYMKPLKIGKAVPESKNSDNIKNIK